MDREIWRKAGAAGLLCVAIPEAFGGLGADNLFDVYPDKVGIVSANGGGKYGAFSPFGLTGGYYYTRVGYKF